MFENFDNFENFETNTSTMREMKNNHFLPANGEEMENLLSFPPSYWGGNGEFTFISPQLLRRKWRVYFHFPHTRGGGK